MHRHVTAVDPLVPRDFLIDAAGSLPGVVRRPRLAAIKTARRIGDEQLRKKIGGRLRPSLFRNDVPSERLLRDWVDDRLPSALKLPCAISGVIANEFQTCELRTTVPSKLAKKNVLFRFTGPPIAPPNWFRRMRGTESAKVFRAL